ncbi:hypothetical protein [Pseudomonas sp. M30-35]|uniref:hypothetical protein n=1 Tax=Pseudomonas sp. M30-35 TaxID=1981174 RepID=UPI000B3C2E3A|nr:hypothetical protein [Pseudomonas sp. M30-35]ARU88283.1 hypothetical protein B9K09_10050 [Pseudomonas sp. M30-35]
MHYYSALTNRCYIGELKENYKAKGNWPEDARQLSAELFAEVVTNRPNDKVMVAGNDGLPILTIANPVTTESLCIQIDTAADLARLTVAGDPLRATEYERAAAEAQAFKDAGYPTESVPRTVAAYAINGRTAQQSADSILAESAAYIEALYCLRETRLQAKELVRQAMGAGNTAQAEDIAAEAIATIEAMISGVGNSPA